VPEADHLPADTDEAVAHSGGPGDTTKSTSTPATKSEANPG